MLGLKRPGLLHLICFPLSEMLLSYPGSLGCARTSNDLKSPLRHSALPKLNGIGRPIIFSLSDILGI